MAWKLEYPGGFTVIWVFSKMTFITKTIIFSLNQVVKNSILNLFRNHAV